MLYKIFRVNLVLMLLAMINFYSSAESIETVVKNGSINSDLRIRNELTQEESKKDRFQQRLRARINFGFDLDENLKVGSRLATSQGNKATSTNATMGGSDSSGMKEQAVYFDQLYVNWTPKKEMSVFAGKFDLPFYRAGSSEMIWDNDVTPEGMSFKYTCECNEKFQLWAVTSGFWSSENSTEADELVALGQLGLKSNFGVHTLVVGLSYFDFTTTNDDPTGSYTGPYSPLPSGIEGYKLLNGFLEFTGSLAGKPFSFYFDYVQNSKAENDKNGATYGFKFGPKLSEKGLWNLNLFYRNQEPNSVVKSLADSDVGSIDVEATRLTLGYSMTNSSHVYASMIKSKRNVSTDADSNFDLAQLDFVFKF